MTEKQPNRNTTGTGTEAAQLRLSRTKQLLDMYKGSDPLLARFLSNKIKRGPSMTSSKYIG